MPTIHSATETKLSCAFYHPDSRYNKGTSATHTQIGTHLLAVMLELSAIRGCVPLLTHCHEFAKLCQDGIDAQGKARQGWGGGGVIFPLPLMLKARVGGRGGEHKISSTTVILYPLHSRRKQYESDVNVVMYQHTSIQTSLVIRPAYHEGWASRRFKPCSKQHRLRAIFWRSERSSIGA